MSSKEVASKALDVFDFFSFVIPGLLLLLPLLVLPSVASELGLSVSADIEQDALHPLVERLEIAVIVLVVSYLLGVLIYYVGRIVERKLLERGGPPSRRVLNAATTAAPLPPVPERWRRSRVLTYL